MQPAAAGQRSTAIRAQLLAVGFCGAIAGASGVTQSILFAQPSTLKYALTVAAPVVLILASTAAHPLLAVMPCVIIALPFAGFGATFNGVHVSILIPLLFAAGVIAVSSGTKPTGLSRTSALVAVALLLLAVPLADSNDARRYLVLLGVLIVVAWLVARTCTLAGGTTVVLVSFVGSAVVQAVLAIWEFRTGRQLNLYSGSGTSVFGPDYFFGFDKVDRPTGSFYDPISLGNVLAVAFPIGLVLSSTLRSARWRVLALGATLVIGVGLVLSLSRMSWIAAVVGVTVALLLLPGGRRGPALVRAAGLVAAAVVVAGGYAHGSIGQRFDSIFHPTSTTVKTAAGDRQRIQLWRAAFATFEQHPIVGVGMGGLLPELMRKVGGLGPSSNAQSTYLQILGETGVAGGAGLLLVLSGLGRDLLVGLRRSRAPAAALAGAGVALLAVWLTDYSIKYAPVAACFAVIFGAVASRLPHEDPQ